MSLGFLVDLMVKIAERLNLKFRFQLVHDNEYGRQDMQTGKWNGIMGELIDGVRKYMYTHPQKTLKLRSKRDNAHLKINLPLTIFCNI